MVVDDDKDILTVVAKGLEQAGFAVHAYSNPIMAVQHVEDGCKDCKILISDIRMPHMTGFQLIRRIKDLRPDMKVIVMTAFELRMNEFGKVFSSTPVDGVIKKPFTPSKLAHTIKEIYNVEKAA